MKEIKIRNNIISYRYADRLNVFGITINNAMLQDSRIRKYLNIPFNLFYQILLKNFAICINEQYYFNTKDDIEHCIENLYNYLLSEKIKGSNLILEYKEG